MACLTRTAGASPVPCPAAASPAHRAGLRTWTGPPCALAPSSRDRPCHGPRGSDRRGAGGLRLSGAGRTAGPGRARAGRGDVTWRPGRRCPGSRAARAAALRGVPRPPGGRRGWTAGSRGCRWWCWYAAGPGFHLAAGYLDADGDPGPGRASQDVPGRAVFLLLAMERQHPAEGAYCSAREYLRRRGTDLLPGIRRSQHPPCPGRVRCRADSARSRVCGPVPSTGTSLIPGASGTL